MGNSNTVTVNTELGEVQVRRMVLADYAELLRAVNQLPAAVQNFTKDKTKEQLTSLEWPDLFKILPAILADAWPDFAAIIAVPTDKDKDFMLQLDGPDAVDIIDAVLDLNDIARIANAIKKMQARLVKTTQQTSPKQS